MAYKPTLKDIPRESYKPTLADIPKDIDSGYQMPEFPYATRPPTPEETAQAGRDVKSFSAGGAQGLLNIPSGTAELLNPTDYKIPRFDFAPKNVPSQIGQLVAPLAAPAGIEAVGAKGLSYFPKAYEAVNKLLNAAKTRQPLNSLLTPLRTAAETGYISALQNPDDPLTGFGEGFATGGALGALSPVAAYGGKYAAPLAKGAIGAIAGQQVGHPIIGAVAGAGLPIRSFLGIEPTSKIAESMTGGLTPKDVTRSVEASRRLGTGITPGEASGNYPIAGKEGALKRTAEGGQLGFRLEEAEKYKQQKAINRMLDKIYKPSAENENKINELYKKAYQKDVDPIVINAMMQNPIMEDAIKTTQLNPAFANVPPNNYEFLHQVDRTLQRKINGLEVTDPSAAYNYKQHKNMLNTFLKENNPDFEAAQAESQPRIVRGNIEEKLNKEAEDYTAKNFYSRMLNSRSSYRDLLKQTKNFPEAQQDIKDMRVAWKNLSNMKTTGQAEAQGKSALDNARNMGNFLITAVKNVAGANADIDRLKFIYSNDWEKELAKLTRIKDRRERIKAMSDHLARTGSKAGLTGAQISNLLGILDENEKQ